jgi:hypothetical protein
MKKTLLTATVFFCLLVLTQSCTKQSQDGFMAPVQPAAKTITATVSSGQTYIFNAGYPGTMNIDRQASHYQVSETTIDENGAVIYKYIPAKGYQGADEVMLTQNVSNSGDNNGGCSQNHSGTTVSSSTTVIKITVAN